MAWGANSHWSRADPWIQLTSTGSGSSRCLREAYSTRDSMPCSNQRAQFRVHGTRYRAGKWWADVSPRSVSCEIIHFRWLLLIQCRGPDPREVLHAKELCEDLLGNVKEQYERFKESPPQQSRGYSTAPYQQNDRQGYVPPGSNYGGYAGQQPAAQTTAAIQSPPGITGAPGAPGAGSSVDYGAQYAQYYGGQDPYSAYGGYQAYYAMYQQFYQQQAQSTAPGALPPGPPSEQPPPPPPPSGPPPSGSPPSANGSYNSVSIFRPSQPWLKVSYLL